MSHVVSIAIEIKDLDCLGAACASLGLELIRDQKVYKWWGTSVGDYPIPAGFTAADLGKCDHAIRIKGDPSAYEIGVVPRRDGKAGYTLLMDFYGQHHLMSLVGGESASKLKQEYAHAVAVKQARKAGFRVLGSSIQSDGSIKLRVGR